MQSYRCKCGKAEFFGSDSPKDCQGCDECGTTFAQHPDHHKERIPHDPKPQFDRNTGKSSAPYCRSCYAKL